MRMKGEKKGWFPTPAYTLGPGVRKYQFTNITPGEFSKTGAMQRGYANFWTPSYRRRSLTGVFWC